MAAIDAVPSISHCHCCSTEFSNRFTLNSHLFNCSKSTEMSTQTFRLDQIQEKMLQMVRLRLVTKTSSSSSSSCRSLTFDEETLQIPLSNLYSKGFLTSSNQCSFNDDDCALNSIEILENVQQEEKENDENQASFHRYKYSRREREQFYRQIKRAVRRKCLTPLKPVRRDDSNRIFNDEKHFLIQIPTQIFSRQQICSTTNSIYPLLLDPNYSHLVHLSSETIFFDHLNEMNIFFHLINSIASQEFQYLITQHDQQHHLSYTSYSMIHLFRQTFYDANQNLKRTFSQSFSSQNDQESTIPPLKIRRYDHSSYEIKNRSTASSSSSASSGMSITQINHAQASQSSDFDRRRSETRPKKFVSKLSDQQTNSNSSSIHFHLNNDHDRRDLSDYSIESPSQNDEHHSERNGTNDYCLSNSSNPRQSNSPNLIRDSTSESHQPKYQSVVLNDGARIRIVNCSNDNSKPSSTRLSHLNSNKRSSNQLIDENGSTKMTRLHARKISSSHSKTAEITEISTSLYPTHALGLTNSEIARQWSTHCVFYRCHACSHEEFFVVFSRECMRLHVSSQHGNMEENFKQRLSNFLNNQGRPLKIFQHYLKWQQPWSEKEIDQLFQLSNVPSTRTNGAL